MTELLNKSLKKIVLIDSISNDQYNYIRINNEIEKIIKYIKEKNKSIIFLFCKNNLQSILGYLACLKSENVVCLLNNDLNEQLINKLICIYNPKYILKTEEEDNKNIFFKNYYIKNTINKLNIWENKNKINLIPIYPETAILLPTSGTTGDPKFVRLTYKNIYENANSIKQYLKIDENEKAITCLPIYYSYGLSIINSHFLGNSKIIVTNSNIITHEFWDLMEKYQITTFAGVPYTYQVLDKIKFDKNKYPYLKTMTQAGGRLNKTYIEKFYNIMNYCGGKFFVMYGQTEATARISYVPPEKLIEKKDSIGIPIPNGKLLLYNDNKKILKPKINGEIIYEGPNVMLGYASCIEDLSKPNINCGVLKTGDMGYFDEDGFFFITGRINRFAKIYGFRINLEDIEKELEKYGTCAALEEDDKLKIYCEFISDYKKIEQELSNKYKLNIKVFNLYKIDKLPLTPNGKIDYKGLKYV